MADERSQAAEPAGAHASETASLVERLVPGLARRLGGSIDEIEIGRDGWRVRIRRAGTVTGPAGSAPIATASSAAGPTVTAAAAHTSTNGVGPGAGAGPHLPHPPRLAPVHAQPRTASGPGRLVATSPAVGVFMPRGGVSIGSRVRAGDRLGMVDLLGVPQDVVAPADGVLSASLVEAGEGVEYGQELLVIEALA